MYKVDNKIIRDPIYNFIEVDKDVFNGLLLEIIDTQEFQRLKHIRQTGLSFFTYPTAQHTRFDHSLGVYHLAKEFLSNISTEEIDDETKGVFLVLALIHDIGHAAFSHVFEKMVKQIIKRRKLDVKACEHEDWLLKIINSGETQIHDVLFKDQGIGKYVLELTKFVYRDKFKCMEKIHAVRPRGSWLFLIKLLSSELDIDRLDYLLRDSYFTGVAYGIYDFERLKRSMIYDSEFKRFNVREKDILTVEGYFIARVHMYRMFYYHKTTLSAESLFRNIFLRAWDLYTKGKLDVNFLLPPIKSLFENVFSPSVQDYIKIIDPLVMTQISLWVNTSDNVLRDLCERFLSRRLFKPIIIKGKVIEPSINREIIEIVEKHGYDPEYYYDYISVDSLRYSKFSYDTSPEKYAEDTGGVIVEKRNKRDPSKSIKRDISDVSKLFPNITNITIEPIIVVPTDEIRNEILERYPEIFL